MPSWSSSPVVRFGVPCVVMAGLGGVAAGLFLRPEPRSRPAVPAAAPATVAGPAAKPAPRRDSGIRIGLRRLSGKTTVTVKPVGTAVLRDPDTGRKLATLPDGKPVQLVADFTTGGIAVKGKGISLNAPALSLAGGWLQIGRRRYPGTLAVRPGGTGLQLVNELEIEQYLEGVLPGELPASFGVEAQKALAVAARSYSLVQRGKHGEFDLCDGPHCQMYVGARSDNPRAIAAVRATRHQCLWSGEDLVYAFYSADCGGESTFGAEVPLKDKPAEPLPYLTPVRDAPEGGSDYCSRSPYHSWTKRFDRQDLERRLNSEPETYIGRLVDVKVTDVDDTGRVREVLLVGKEPAQVASADDSVPAWKPVERRVSGWDFRRSVGPMKLKSTLMRLDQPEPGIYRFTGSGFGHGLGLCQIGADGMARHGKSYREILAHYYPGTSVASLEER